MCSGPIDLNHRIASHRDPDIRETDILDLVMDSSFIFKNPLHYS